MILRWRRGAGLGWLNIVSFIAALLFSAFLLAQNSTARSVPAIHEVTTDLDDLPRFGALEVLPDNGRAALAAMDPESRWKALHRQAYGDLATLRVPTGVVQAVERAAALAGKRGWDISPGCAASR